MAERATLVIDTIDVRVDGTISGTLSDAYFVETSADGTRLIEDGLSYCLDVWEFSQTFERIGW
jgi:hypothetical protein